MRVAPPTSAILPLLLTVTVLGAPSLLVELTATPPKIDGDLHDSAWTSAAHSDAFRQTSPLENADPTERSEVWVTYDADNLYIACAATIPAAPLPSGPIRCSMTRTTGQTTWCGSSSTHSSGKTTGTSSP